MRALASGAAAAPGGVWRRDAPLPSALIGAYFLSTVKLVPITSNVCEPDSDAAAAAAAAAAADAVADEAISRDCDVRPGKLERAE